MADNNEKETKIKEFPWISRLSNLFRGNTEDVFTTAENPTGVTEKETKKEK